MGENTGDPNAAMMQLMQTMQRQLTTMEQRLVQVEQPPANRNQRQENGVDREDGQETDSSDGEPPQNNRRRRRAQRNNQEMEEEEEDCLRPNSMNMKLKAPTFAGRVDPEAYLEWEQRMEHIFAYYKYTDQKKLALAVAQLTNHALSWWDREVSDRRRSDTPQVTTWREMKQLMKKRYVPTYYHRDLQKKFRKLTQGTKSVEEYFEEFEHLRNRLELDDDAETTMAQFLDGLHEKISHKVEMHPYHDLKDILHHAIQAEHHIKKKMTSLGRVKTIQNWDQGRAKTPFSSTSQVKPLDKGKAVAIDNRFKSKPIEPNQGKFPSPNNSRTRDITCFKCKGKGHMAKDCPNTRVMILTDTGEYESQDEVDVAMDDVVVEEVDCEPEYGESLVIRRVLNLTVHPDELAQRENIFHTRCTVQDKMLKEKSSSSKSNFLIKPSYIAKALTCKELVLLMIFKEVLNAGFSALEQDLPKEVKDLLNR
ncbi:unnamed protein product, partial [Arabidopsis halleri]